jgi:hypothetical protein
MKTIINLLIGLLTIILVTILEFLVTLPFGEPNPDTIARFVNIELLLTALPAALVTYVLAWLFRTKSKSQAMHRSVIWTLVLGLWYLVIGLGNDTFGDIFGQLGIYVLLICSFAGPLIFSKVKNLH